MMDGEGERKLERERERMKRGEKKKKVVAGGKGDAAPRKKEKKNMRPAALRVGDRDGYKGRRGVFATMMGEEALTQTPSGKNAPRP